MKRLLFLTCFVFLFTHADESYTILDSPLPRGLKIAAIPTNSNCPDGWDGQDAEKLKADVIYNWGTHPPVISDTLSIPMIFGRINGCPELGGTPGNDILLGFNEWDGQGDMTREEAAREWHEVEECYPDYRLISPSTINIMDAYYLRAKYRQLFGEYPRWDGIAVHCYKGILDCKGQVWRGNYWSELWGMPLGVWVTEYSGSPPLDDENWETMTQLTPYLMTHVTAYGWFATRFKGDEWWAHGWQSQLIDCESGELTRLGVFYRDFGPRSYLPVVSR